MKGVSILATGSWTWAEFGFAFGIALWQGRRSRGVFAASEFTEPSLAGSSYGLRWASVVLGMDLICLMPETSGQGGF